MISTSVQTAARFVVSGKSVVEHLVINTDWNILQQRQESDSLGCEEREETRRVGLGLSQQCQVSLQESEVRMC